MKKVRIPKWDQGLNLFLRKKGKVSNKHIAVIPCLEQYKDNILEIGVRTVLQTGASKSLETGARTAPEHGFLENQAREESAAMDSPAP